ncbi:hypothetical protein LINGRAHAP2_LOCUS20508 [Linum grandiflorum]
MLGWVILGCRLGAALMMIVGLDQLICWNHEVLLGEGAIYEGSCLMVEHINARYVAGGARRRKHPVMSSSSSDNKAISHLMRNKSVGDRSEFVSETKEKPPRSRFGAERYEHI